MEEEIIDVIEDTKNNLYTKIGKKYSLQDVRRTWNYFSEYVYKNLQNRKCVKLKGIGLFTLKDWKLDIGIRKQLTHYKPVFHLSKELLEDFHLYQRKHYISDNIPIAPLNVYEAAVHCKCSKEIILLCYDEIVHGLRRLIADEKDIILKFPQLGELTITKNTVKYKFYTEIKQTKQKSEARCFKYESVCKPLKTKGTYPCEIHSQSFF